jgi:polar amino acid transport system permease protein
MDPGFRRDDGGTEGGRGTALLDKLALLSFGAAGWGDELLLGAGLSVLLAAATLPFGLLLGLGLALAKASEEPSLRLFGHALTTLFRGLPELLTLYLVYYGGQAILRELSALLGLGAPWPLDAFVAGMLALGVVFAAYASEVLLGALQVVSRGSAEAARALGLSRWHRFRLVTLPELVRLALPGLSNVLVSLLKQTSLLAVLGYGELLRRAYVAGGSTHRPLLFFAAAALLYLAMTALLALGLRRIRRSLERGVGPA